MELYILNIDEYCIGLLKSASNFTCVNYRDDDVLVVCLELLSVLFLGSNLAILQFIVAILSILSEIVLRFIGSNNSGN